MKELTSVDISPEAAAWMKQFMPGGKIADPRFLGQTMTGVASLLKTDLLERERELQAALDAKECHVSGPDPESLLAQVALSKMSERER